MEKGTEAESDSTGMVSDLHATFERGAELAADQ